MQALFSLIIKKKPSASKRLHRILFIRLYPILSGLKKHHFYPGLQPKVRPHSERRKEESDCEINSKRTIPHCERDNQNALSLPQNRLAVVPKEISEAGYRHYGADELKRLQEILFNKELDIPLSEIKTLLDEDAERTST